jgi:hypothetical protein
LVNNQRRDFVKRAKNVAHFRCTPKMSGFRQRKQIMDLADKHKLEAQEGRRQSDRRAAK